MRWDFKKLQLKASCGRERITCTYLYFPVNIDYEWRWLEKAYIKEECRLVNVCPDQYVWIKKAFITEAEYIKHYDIATGESYVPARVVDPLCNPSYSPNYNAGYNTGPRKAS